MAHPIKISFCKRCDGKRTIETDTWAIIPCPECKEGRMFCEHGLELRHCPLHPDEGTAFPKLEKYHGYVIEKVGKGYRCHIQRTSRSEWIRATKDSDTATQAVLEALKEK